MAADYTVERIEPNEEGLELFLSKYKPFRLNALKTDPSFFGSNYAREVAQDDEFWYNRLRNPKTKTFLALSPERDVLSSATMVIFPEIFPVFKKLLGIEDPPDDDSATLVQWVVNAVYTVGPARRKGISSAILDKSVEYVLKDSASKGLSCLVVVNTLNGNKPALSMYEKAGFIRAPDEDGAEDHGEVMLYMWKPAK